MDERKRQVLHAIIKDYIATAEPVGSRVVSKKYDLGVSPATIRNEMSDLEEQGYIEQPHISAGRKPSDKGYRYYVDRLMEKEEVGTNQTGHALPRFNGHWQGIGKYIRQASQFMANLVDYTIMISSQGHGQGLLQKIQLVPVSPWQILLVLITDTGLVSHRLLQLSQPFEPIRLIELETTLEKKLLGRRLNQLSPTLLAEIRNEAKQRPLAEEVLALMEKVSDQEQDEQVYIGGLMNMFSQPEFRDMTKLKQIIEFLEEESGLRELLKPHDSAGAFVVIGRENPTPDIQECSVVTATYMIRGKPAGTIGILGPTRMSYAKTMALIELWAKEMSETLS